MFAIIHRSQFDSSASAMVAGKPLLFRQMQWLRAIGCDQIIVEIPRTDEALALKQRIVEECVAIPGVIWFATESQLPLPILAKMAGYGDKPFLAVPHGVIGDGDLTELFVTASGGSVVALYNNAISKRSQAILALRLIAPGGDTPKMASGPGWLALIDSERAAFELTLAIMNGSVSSKENAGWPLQIHAAQVSPGVWVARGAKVDPSSKLIGPVMIGKNVELEANTTVGPNVVIERNSLVSEGSHISHCHVEEHTFIPRDVRIESGLIRHGWAQDLEVARHSIAPVPTVDRRSVFPAANTRRRGVIAVTALAFAAAMGVSFWQPSPNADQMKMVADDSEDPDEVYGPEIDPETSTAKNVNTSDAGVDWEEVTP